MKQELYDHLKAHLKWAPSQDQDKFRFLVLALCGEVGELANLVKKEWRDGVSFSDKIMSEVADIGNYLYMITILLNINLEDYMLQKLEEVEGRDTWKKRNG